jgi:hypothetical protein
MDGTPQYHGIGIPYLLIVGQQVIFQLADLRSGAQPDTTFAGGVAEIVEFNKLVLATAFFHYRLYHPIHIGIAPHNTGTKT